MNPEIHRAYINALLADASYVNGLQIAYQSGSLADALDDRMTEFLSSYIGENFRVLTQYTESDVTSTGFSVTVWQEIATSQVYISFRGTQGLADWVNDIDLAIGTGV